MSIHVPLHRRWLCRALLAGLAGTLPALPPAVQAQSQPAAANPQTPETPPAPPPAPAPAAQAPDVAALRQEIEALKQAYEQKITELEHRIQGLEATAGAPPAAPGAPAAPAPETQAAVPAAPPTPEAQAAASAAPPAGGAAQATNYFNPSVSVIGNFLGVAGHNSVAPLHAFEQRESEVGLQAIVDPYARADFFLSFGEHGVDVEEGFATFTSLPGDLLVKVGRMRTAFGKINTLHLHVLPWPDEPLPVVNLLGGGEEGWIGTGISVGRLIALPGDTFSELTLQVFDGNSNSQLFSAPKRGDYSYNAHYRVFRDLTEATNLDLGVSYGYGHNGTASDALTRLEGIDFTVRYKPLRTATYHSVSVRGEFMRSQRDQPSSLLGNQLAYGGFLSGEYQLAKRWFTGARVEASDHADDAKLRDSGEALTLTFWPSEFSQLRGELRRRRYSLTRDLTQTANELLLQVQFAIGAHGAHPF
jgi:hypothetical protein